MFLHVFGRMVKVAKTPVTICKLWNIMLKYLFGV